MNKEATLIIDQDRKCSRDLALALRVGGHLVVCAHGVGEALRALSLCRPDAAVLDLDLGEMSGLVLIPLLRLANGECRIVIRSAHFGSVAEREALALGACKVLAKAEGPAAVIASLRSDGRRPHAALVPEQIRTVRNAQPGAEADPAWPDAAWAGLRARSAVLLGHRRQFLR